MDAYVISGLAGKAVSLRAWDSGFKLWQDNVDPVPPNWSVDWLSMTQEKSIQTDLWVIFCICCQTWSCIPFFPPVPLTLSLMLILNYNNMN